MSAHTVEQPLEHFTVEDRDNLERYLHAQGWQHVPIASKLLHQWVSRADKPVSVQVPQDPTLSDFSWLIGRALERVAAAQGCDLSHLIESIRHATWDLVKVQLSGTNDLPLIASMAALNSLPKLLQASAQAVQTKRAHYRGSLSREIEAYMSSLRLAQTEVGSYILRVYSPLGELDEEAPMLPGIAPLVLPFGRRVTSQLIANLQATQEAARSRDEEALREAVAQGVSANLLDALVAFGEVSAVDEGFAIELDWASALNPPMLPRRVTFETRWLPAMRRAADMLRHHVAGPQQLSLSGFVQHLSEVRPGDTPRQGKIKMSVLLHGAMRLVEVELHAESYNLAATAHANSSLLCVSGILEKRQDRWAFTQVDAVGIDVASEVALE